MTDSIIIKVSIDNKKPQEEFNQFIEELDKEWNGKYLCDEDIPILNEKVHEFKQYMKREYPHFHYMFKISGDIAYYDATWDVDTIAKAHRLHCHEYHVEKEEYTRREVNNMLFDLCDLYDVIKSYSPVHNPYSDGDDVFDGLVEVECRYYWEEDL